MTVCVCFCVVEREKGVSEGEMKEVGWWGEREGECACSDYLVGMSISISCVSVDRGKKVFLEINCLIF